MPKLQCLVKHVSALDQHVLAIYIQVCGISIIKLIHSIVRVNWKQLSNLKGGSALSDRDRSLYYSYSVPTGNWSEIRWRYYWFFQWNVCCFCNFLCFTWRFVLFMVDYFLLKVNRKFYYGVNLFVLMLMKTFFFYQVGCIINNHNYTYVQCSPMEIGRDFHLTLQFIFKPNRYSIIDRYILYNPLTQVFETR